MSMNQMLREELRSYEAILWSQSPSELHERKSTIRTQVMALFLMICVLFWVSFQRSNETSLGVALMVGVGCIAIWGFLAMSSLRKATQYARSTVYALTSSRVILVNANPKTREKLVSSVEYKNVHKVFNIGKGNTRTVRLQLNKRRINPAVFEFSSVAGADELNALIIKHSPNLS